MEEEDFFGYNDVYNKLKRWFKENQFDIPQLLGSFYKHACEMNDANDARVEAEEEGGWEESYSYESDEEEARKEMLEALEELLEEIKELE